MNSIGKQMTEKLEGSIEPKRDSPESQLCGNKYWELTNLTSQVQMMSDSLAACKQMSKYRSLKKMYTTKKNTHAVDLAPEDPVQILLSRDEKCSNRNKQSNNEDNTVIVSYLIEKSSPPKKIENDADNESRTSPSINSSHRCSSLEEAQKFERQLEKNSAIKRGKQKELKSIRMINLIEKELNTLLEIAPPVAVLVSAFFETLSHYKECDRCNKKITPFLFWILNRIQKLVNHVKTKKRRNHRWPKDCSYLWPRPLEPALENILRTPICTSENTYKGVSPRKPFRRFESKFEKVVSKGTLGLQLLLEVKPKKIKKRFFARAELQPQNIWESSQSFAVIYLKEFESLPLVEVLQLSHNPNIQLNDKKEVVEIKEFAFSHRVKFDHNFELWTSFVVLIPEAGLTISTVGKPEFNPNLTGLVGGTKETKGVKNKLRTLLREDEGNQKIVRESESHLKHSNDNSEFFQSKTLAGVSGILQEFLHEIEKEKMQDQEAQSLETLVNSLQEIMAEVHENQVALSKILLEKGIYSQFLFRLTNPSMLEKENEMIRQVAEIQVFGSQNLSTRAFQAAVNDLTHRCSLKNRMIMIVLKGLQSDIPKECWEDMLEYLLNEPKPKDDLHPKKSSELVEQTTSFTADEQQKSKLEAWELRTEELPSEEEPKVIRIEGEHFEEKLKNFSQRDGMSKNKDFISMTDLDDFPANTQVFSATNQPDIVGNTIRNLENQVSLLNVENERLWHEVYDLKNLLKNSVKTYNKRINCLKSNKEPTVTRTSGKTVNVTIKIMDKDHRRVKDEFPVKLSKISLLEREKSRSSPIKFKSAESLLDVKNLETERSNPEQNLRVNFMKPEYSIHSKSDRCRSESDLNSVDDISADITNYRHENDRLESVLKERKSEQAPYRPMHQVATAGLNPSAHESYRKVNPVVWVPTKRGVTPDARDCYKAGSSRRLGEVTFLPLKPSLMKLAEKSGPEEFLTMTNERELQTIPENDCSPSATSRSIGQEIQRLRARVRLIHKDVTVLKAKNDRIDKLLSRLINDVIERSQSFGDINNDFNRLMDQLG